MDPNLDPENRGNLVADLALIGRTDLRPVFDNLFDRGEIDLETVTPDDIEEFLKRPKIPSHFIDIESFYHEESIQGRQERWKEEERQTLEAEFTSYLLENAHRIGRNEPCPCGSGKKFKKCHLPIAEEMRKQAEEADKRDEELFRYREAISDEREAEVGIRRLLAKYDRTDLFPEIKESILRTLKAPNEEFLAKGPSWYLQPVMSKLDFLEKTEMGSFLRLYQVYWNALVNQLKRMPKDKAIH
ncbi:MAG: SEC-C domain-containing protein [Deltaproteobacteria bacterium]|nr:SEC-C domain-containing protein [Deltaproteobacteria bacterium]